MLVNFLLFIFYDSFNSLFFIVWVRLRIRIFSGLGLGSSTSIFYMANSVFSLSLIVELNVGL